MVDGDGVLLECTSANFFGLREGVLLTADQGVLEGITRKVFMHLARELGLPISMEPLHVEALGTLDGAFLSSSTRALVPIVRIAGAPVGDGRPAPIAVELLEAYYELARREARPATQA